MCDYSCLIMKISWNCQKRTRVKTYDVEIASPASSLQQSFYILSLFTHEYVKPSPQSLVTRLLNIGNASSIQSDPLLRCWPVRKTRGERVSGTGDAAHATPSDQSHLYLNTNSLGFASAGRCDSPIMSNFEVSNLAICGCR